MEVSRSEVWSLIKECTAGEAAGKQVTTSLLGDVDARCMNGKLVGIIPFDLTVQARHHGFRIISASFHDVTYTLEKME